MFYEFCSNMGDSIFGGDQWMHIKHIATVTMAVVELYKLAVLSQTSQHFTCILQRLVNVVY
jgi:hypothetical protein